MKGPKLVHGHRFEIMTFHFLNSDDLSLLQRVIGHLRNANVCSFNCLTAMDTDVSYIISVGIIAFGVWNDGRWLAFGLDAYGTTSRHPRQGLDKSLGRRLNTERLMAPRIVLAALSIAFWIAVVGASVTTGTLSIARL